jgi:hypothetical protein
MMASDTRQEFEEYIAHVVFPATKEELINGLLVNDAPGRMVALVERLPRDRYQDRQELREDLEEVSRVHADEVAQARTYDDYLAVVLRHVGDVRHATKEAYNRVVDHVVHIAVRQHMLDERSARQMRERLDAEYAELRGSMSEVYDNQAPINPRADLPRFREDG